MQTIILKSVKWMLVTNNCSQQVLKPNSSSPKISPLMKPMQLFIQTMDHNTGWVANGHSPFYAFNSSGDLVFDLVPADPHWWEAPDNISGSCFQRLRVYSVAGRSQLQTRPRGTWFIVGFLIKYTLHCRDRHLLACCTVHGGIKGSCV